MNSIVNRIVIVGRVVVVLAWAAFLIVAWYTKRLEVINPSYRWMSLASAAALVLVGVALLPSGRAPAHAHDHDDEHAHDHDHEETGLAASCCCEPASAGELVFQALFFLPIVLSLCTPRGALSAESMARKGIHELQSQAQVVQSPQEVASTPAATAAPEEEETLPPLSMADMYECLMMGNPDQLKGHPVDLVGQHYVDDRSGENQFVVTRIVVTCCLADAEVIGIRVNPKKQFNPGESAGSGPRPEWVGEPGGRDLARSLSKLGPWVRVSGKLKMLADRFGTQAIFVDDAVVTETKPPDELLLYPRQRGASW